MLKLIKRKSNSFGLLEVLLSSMILTIVLGAILILGSEFKQNLINSKIYYQAAVLADEPLNIMAKAKDSNVIKGDAWDMNLASLCSSFPSPDEKITLDLLDFKRVVRCTPMPGTEIRYNVNLRKEINYARNNNPSSTAVPDRIPTDPDYVILETEPNQFVVEVTVSYPYDSPNPKTIVTNSLKLRGDIDL